MSQYMKENIEQLQNKTTVAEEKVALLERELAVINPDQKTSIASSQVQQLTTELTNVTAARIKAESVYNSLQSDELDAALASPQGTRIADDLTKLKDAQAKFADGRLRYLPMANEYQQAETAVKQLQIQVDKDVASARGQAKSEWGKQKDTEERVAKQLTDVRADYDHLNMRMLDYQQAKQEATSLRKLYDEMLQRINENKINASFQNDMVRLMDEARPQFGKMYPNQRLNLIVAFLVRPF